MADEPLAPTCAGCREPSGTCFPDPCKRYLASKESQNRAVEIARRERVPSGDEVERVARVASIAFYGLDMIPEPIGDPALFHPGSKAGKAMAVAKAAISAMTPSAEVERLRTIETAARALIDDVQRRHPGEDLRCPLMRAVDDALALPTAPSGDPKP